MGSQLLIGLRTADQRGQPYIHLHVGNSDCPQYAGERGCGVRVERRDTEGERKEDTEFGGWWRADTEVEREKSSEVDCNKIYSCSKNPFWKTLKEKLDTTEAGIRS